ncbi:hypothetical protein GIB67_022832 [Kingdonia uniflora]|uniref:Cytochrome P450 n=1 Tax=Kingdonia uniflora TaxID=39325 RepID=A0A7J7P6U2_9MAGN|nr:hypothetical protein GIB67_022832 [Kingdonia uniflora]
MEFIQTLCMAMGILLLFILGRVLSLYWVTPSRVYRKLRRSGFGGPRPSFPLGNLKEMYNKEKKHPPFGSLTTINHDIHSTVFPYFARWIESHGKVFTYWLGTKPFLYIGEPEFLKQMSSGILAKNWGKPNVFKHDRKPMFGKGLVMAEGEEWVLHRHVITPAFSALNLKAMMGLMEDSAINMLDTWSRQITSGEKDIDVERELTTMAAEIIAKASFGLNHQTGREVFDKLRAMQITLFRSNRLVGVPFSKFLYLKQTLESRRLGNEIDELLLSVVNSRKASPQDDHYQQDLLGILLKENKLTSRELVDECKTFFFGGHETTALALTWTLLLLGIHPEWQTQLRDEIKEVTGDGPLDSTKLAQLRKMGWVMNEVLRLYSPAPNVQRQARGDIKVGDRIIPNGTNIWIDVVGMHHDPALWGDDVNEFKPERFKDNIHGGCKHKMGFLPFGFGGRMCVGRNLTMMEYRIVLSLILSRFSLSISPNYSHSPTIMLSCRPSHGLQLIVQPL